MSCGSFKLNLCVCVCPALTAYISLAMGPILFKLGENVETLVRLIEAKFHKYGLVIMTSLLFFFKLILREATLLKAKGKDSVQRETIMLR